MRRTQFLMSTSSEVSNLVAFIRSAKQRNVEDEFIVALLRQNGWTERRIFSAFSVYYEDVLGSPLPTRGSRIESARDAFFYLLAFVMLGIWTVALIWLGNVLIDRALPNALDNPYDIETFRQAVAGQLASLIIAFPIFIIVSRSIVRETQRRPEALDSGVRKWLTYIALVVTAVTLVGDAVWFLQQFLTGDLTLRFTLKTCMLFVVAGGVFWYYLGTVRPEITVPARDRIFGWAATLVVAIAIVLGFTGIGTPLHQRDVALDQQRVSDLQSIRQQISSSYASEHRLPRTLGDVISNLKNDPLTQRPYEYVPGKKAAYRLCATFATDDRALPADPFWKHGLGRTCYALKGTQGSSP
jgi:uncharacterized protein DUF5671